MFPMWDGPVAIGAEKLKLMLTDHVKSTGGEMSLAVQREEEHSKALTPFSGSTRSTLHTNGIFKNLC